MKAGQTIVPITVSPCCVFASTSMQNNGKGTIPCLDGTIPGFASLALAAPSRYLLALWFAQRFGSAFSYGIFFVPKRPVSDHAMDPKARKYRQAAIGYLVYGVIYLAGAIYLGRMGRGPGGTVWWYLIGAAMTVGFPYLIWKRFKWMTRVLAVLLFVRVIGLLRIAVRSDTESVPLPWGGEIAMSHGAIVFMLIALTTCVLLARAGWQRGMR